MLQGRRCLHNERALGARTSQVVRDFFPLSFFCFLSLGCLRNAMGRRAGDGRVDVKSNTSGWNQTCKNLIRFLQDRISNKSWNEGAADREQSEAFSFMIIQIKLMIFSSSSFGCWVERLQTRSEWKISWRIHARRKSRSLAAEVRRCRWWMIRKRISSWSQMLPTAETDSSWSDVHEINSDSHCSSCLCLSSRKHSSANLMWKMRKNACLTFALKILFDCLTLSNSRNVSQLSTSFLYREALIENHWLVLKNLD